MRFYIIISPTAADQLIALAERQKRSVSAQAAWILEEALVGTITGHANEHPDEVAYADR